MLEATNARDNALRSLTDALSSLRQKNAIIDRLQSEINPFSSAFMIAVNPEVVQLKEETRALEGTIVSLRQEIQALKDNATPLQFNDAQPKVRDFF